VIHLASHYVTDKRSSMLSRLLLAKEASGNGRQDDGALHAHEVYAMKLSRPRLVVLAACQTGVERYFEGEGMIGMSRTFLASGVPLVVASLWPIDSSATRELMVSFHRYRRELSTAQALQRAQKEMASRKGRLYEHPHYWASFELFGGYANF
jgi:CHAT domain-containing protein